jgi:hypothetical protein
MYHVVTQETEERPKAGANPANDVAPPPSGSGSGGDGVARSGSDGTERTDAIPTEAEGDGRDGSARKERVLHTRVPAVLERELKRFADNLRIPVSNLVRTILEDALSVADAATENVEERLKRAARHLEKEREKLKKRMEHDPLEGIVAFQEVTLAVSATCTKCERELPRGTRAHLGIGEASVGGRRFVCEDCLPRA